MSKRILVTGCGGFIGSHFVAHILVNTDWDIIGIDSWRHKGLSERLSESEHYKANKKRLNVYTHDLSAPISKVLLNRIGHVDYVINFASQSHVDRSISDPVPFVENNVKLILNMLEYARQSKPSKFIQIGTDEVYGATDGVETHPEWSSILPSNPYSASKAMQDDACIAWWRTYEVPMILTNVMNTVGETQDAEKFIPMVIKKVLAGETVQIHSDPTKQVPGSRFWLHARNTSDALLHILRNEEVQFYPKNDRPQRFNIVGEKQISNLEIAQLVAEIMGKELKYELVDAHSSRPGHDAHYGLDGTKLRSHGYTFPVNLKDSLSKMIKWTLENPRWLE